MSQNSEPWSLEASRSPLGHARSPGFASHLSPRFATPSYRSNANGPVNVNAAHHPHHPSHGNRPNPNNPIPNHGRMAASADESKEDIQKRHNFYMFEFRTKMCPSFAMYKCDESKPYTCKQAHYDNHLRRKPVLVGIMFDPVQSINGRFRVSMSMCLGGWPLELQPKPVYVSIVIGVSYGSTMPLVASGAKGTHLPSVSLQDSVLR